MENVKDTDLAHTWESSVMAQREPCVHCHGSTWEGWVFTRRQKPAIVNETLRPKAVRDET